MRRLLVVVVLLSLMLFMRSFQAHAESPDNVITLAAIGFVVLATFAVADMGTRLSLPRVTGFIVTGVALGPSAANILSREVVTEMRMFNTLALGLIATSAGLELDLKTLLPSLKTLGSTTAVKVILGVPLVGLTLFGASHFIDLGVSSFEARAALAVVMGVLSIGTSPSIALALLTETKAKGRLSDLVLGAAVFKDLVVVVCLAIAVAAADALLNPSGANDSSVLVHVSRELAGSLLAGAILGGILIAYVRFIQAEMLLFVAAMILVVAELCQVFHLELLLVFIAAGFTVRNFSTYEHELMKPLELVALPVFVVFFTIAGAGINLAVAWTILPAALAVCVVRAGVYWLAASIGNNVGRESLVVKRNAWSAYLPQAGVTLGLVGVAAQKLPVLGPQITTTGMAIVAINLLVGPVTLRRALFLAGEIPGTKAQQPGMALATPLPKGDAGAKTQLATSEPLDALLADYVERTRESTTASLGALMANRRAHADATERWDEPSQEERVAVARAYRTAAKSWYEAWVDTLSALPTDLLVEQTLAELAPRANDGRGVRIRLWWRRLRWSLSKRKRFRRVPVRLCARVALELPMVELATKSLDSALERQFAPQTSASAEDPGAESARWRRALDDAFIEFTRLLGDSNTPHLHGKALQFSAIEPAIRTELALLDDGRDDFYAARAAALWGSELVQRRISALNKTVTGLLAVHLIEPARAAIVQTGEAIAKLVAELSQFGSDANAPNKPPLSPAGRDELSSAYGRAVQALTRSIPRASHVVRELGSAFRSDIDELPSDVRCYQPTTDSGTRYGAIRRIDLRHIAETHLIKRLIPTLDQSARGLSNAFAHLPREVKDCLEPVFVFLESSGDDTVAGAGFRQRVQASCSRLATLRELLLHQVEEEIDRQEVAAAASLEALEREVSTSQLLGETTTHRLRQLATRLARHFQPLFTGISRARSAAPDAAAVLASLAHWRQPNVDFALMGWLSQRPVRDERIFSDQAKVLERILQIESSWRKGTRAAVLVSGEFGSGKTSLLNMCELELRNPRTFRLDAEGQEQSFTLHDTLANLLGCRPTTSSIVYALAVQRPILLVDNLPRWLARGVEPLEELKNIVLLIARTPETLWVVALDPSLEERAAPFVDTRAAFTTRIDVPTATRSDLDVMITSRSSRAKHTVRFKPTLLGKILGRLGLPGDEFLYFNRLQRESRGSPGRALAFVLATASGRERELLLDGRSLPPKAPPLAAWLSVTQLGTLLALLQYGPADLTALAARVGVDVATAELDLSFLRSAGLVSLDNHDYALDDSVRWIVVDELERAGAIRLNGQLNHKQPGTFRAMVGTIGIAVGIAVVVFTTRSSNVLLWWHWLLAVGLIVGACLPAVQNLVSGASLRLVTKLQRGDSLRATGIRGTVRAFLATHVELTNVSGARILVPYRRLLSQSLSVQRGTPDGDLVRARISLTDVHEGSRGLIHRVAQSCPYRAPGSTPSVFVREGETIVEIYSWHRDSTECVETYLASRVARALQNQTPTRPPQE